MKNASRPQSNDDRSSDDAASDLLRMPQPGGATVDANRRVQWLESWLTPAVCRRLGIYQLPDDFLLSVVVPVYNEASTLAELIARVRATDIPMEIILVNDGSTDGTAEVLQSMRGVPGVKIVTHPTNQGKGAALRSGLALVEGDLVIIQDADLEYNPDEYRLLLQPILENRADVVYGSRFSNPDRQVDHFWHQNGNRFITLLSNLFTNLKLTDVETCYKVMRRELVSEIAPTLRERGFGVELEITAKLARRKNVRFYEVPISYQRRSYAEGKKINWRDALWALWCVLRY